MSDYTKNLFRWIAVLPGAWLAGFLATFPLHWILYFTLVNGETISGVNIEPIEYNLYPFVIAIVFILVGSKIAPKHKLKTSVILAVLYVLFIIGSVILGLQNGIEMSFGIRTLGPIVGLLIGLFIIWQKSKYNIKSSTLKILEKCSWNIQALTVHDKKTKQGILLSKMDDIYLNCEKNSCNKKILEDKAKTICTLIECPKNYLENSDLGYIPKKNLTPKEQERERQVCDFINELKSYFWLQNNGFENIYFVPVEENKKTPDLKGEKEKKLFFIEIKTLHIPRKEENDLMLPYIKVKSPDFNHQNGLENKIKYYIEDANKKFEDTKAQNRILIIYSNISGLVDISYMVGGYKPKKLDDILGENFFKEKESKYNMKIIIFD